MPQQAMWVHGNTVVPERTIKAEPLGTDGPLTDIPGVPGPGMLGLRQGWGAMLTEGMKIMQTKRLMTVALLAVLAVTGTARAEAAPRRTSFDPEKHGFGFDNTFTNDFIREIDVRTGGLCGGMVYSALDYYLTKRAIPTQSYRPAVQTRLHDYIYNRQVTSLMENLDKWAEVGFNPFGARDSEFFNWGLQGFGGGRLQELRYEIDRGRPVPLGLQEYGDGSAGNHQVLAIGYDLGRYKGDLGAHREELKIFVYDPNFNGRTMTLVPDLGKQAYTYLERRNKRWRTYFVDKKYRPQEPPGSTPVPVKTAAGPVVRDLLLEIHTGGDDLRGGNDNVHVTVHYRGKPSETIENVNRGRRWIDNYTQTVPIPLRQRVAPEDIVTVVLTTTFSGGMGGDNWNVDRLRVIARGDGFDDREVYSASGTPLVRLTGERRTFRADLR